MVRGAHGGKGEAVLKRKGPEHGSGPNIIPAQRAGKPAGPGRARRRSGRARAAEDYRLSTSHTETYTLGTGELAGGQPFVEMRSLYHMSTVAPVSTLWATTAP